MVTIFAVTGTTGAGKDTLVDAAIEDLQQRGLTPLKVSFSDELRDLSTHIFPWLPKTTDQFIKNAPFEHDKNPNNFTPREIWKRVASTIRGIQDDVLACRAQQTIQELLMIPTSHTIIFIPDLRSKPEDKVLTELRDNGCRLVKVRVVDPKVSIENCEIIDEPTWFFNVDYELTNLKTDADIARFKQIVSAKLNEEGL